MHFATDHVYHIYNRGNNSQKIFFSKDNYLFFLKKIKTYILPYADILAWCLMPNHFHLMVYVHDVEIEVDVGARDRMTSSHPISKKRTLNNSIAIILRSYARAIQKQENLNGSLFQAKTKANCLTQIDGITPSWFYSSFGTIINIAQSKDDPLQICFDYIHLNPVKASLVKTCNDWEFSSARDYAGMRKGKLINREKSNEFGLVY